MTTQSLIITQNTYLKGLPFGSNRLKADGVTNQLLTITKDTELPLVDLDHFKGKFDGVNCGPHYYIELEKARAGYKRWFVWAGHADEVHAETTERTTPARILEDDEKVAAAKATAKMSTQALAEPEAEVDMGERLSIPGISTPTFMNSPVFWLGNKPAPITWGEVLQWDITREPKSAAIVGRILKVCRVMLEVRAMYAQPLIFTSGYRDPRNNRLQGGSSKSRHMQGDAVDFYPKNEGITASGWKSLCNLHRTGGLAAGSGFMHLDLRPWLAHWLYGGGPSFANRRYYV